MTARRARRAVAFGLCLSLAACQGSSPAQPTSSPTTAPTLAPIPTPTPAPTASPAPVPPGVILFHRLGSDGVERYFTIQTDGTNETSLYEAEGCGCAHLSADGTQVLSIGSTGHGTWSLRTQNLDGSGEAVVEPPIATLNLFIGASSADGRVLAFQGMDETDPSRSGLWIASPALTDARQVTPLHDSWLALEPFAVTSDGSRILFFVDTGPLGGITHAGDVYVINADGSGLRQLNPPGAKTGYMGMPVITLSPDGRQAAFGADEAVYVVDIDGGEARAITPRTGLVWAVSWSSTGEWLTYTRFYARTNVVALVRPDGTDDHEISARDETDEANGAMWSPTGDHLLVARDGEGRPDEERDLWIMDLDGTWIGQVTNEPAEYGTYWWAPAASP